MEEESKMSKNRKNKEMRAKRAYRIMALLMAGVLLLGSVAVALMYILL